MQMKEYLLDTFNFNDKANKQVLEKIKELPDKAEAVKLFSHLINCQYKWMARVLQDPKVSGMNSISLFFKKLNKDLKVAIGSLIVTICFNLPKNLVNIDKGQ